MSGRAFTAQGSLGLILHKVPVVEDVFQIGRFRRLISGNMKFCSQVYVGKEYS